MPSAENQSASADDPGLTYEVARTEEVRIRSQLYPLRAGRLSGELFDRRLVVSEISESFNAIREIVLGSRLTQYNKLDLLNQLASIPVVMAPANGDEPLARKSSIHA